MSASPISPIAAMTAIAPDTVRTLPTPATAGPDSFAQLMLNGVSQVNDKVIEADDMVRAFALDDSIPLHQVTYALEHARLSVELMLQVRARLVESFQDIMRMQL